MHPKELRGEVARVTGVPQVGIVCDSSLDDGTEMHVVYAFLDELSCIRDSNGRWTIARSSPTSGLTTWQEHDSHEIDVEFTAVAGEALQDPALTLYRQLTVQHEGVSRIRFRSGAGAVVLTCTPTGVGTIEGVEVGADSVIYTWELLDIGKTYTSLGVRSRASADELTESLDWDVEQ